ncbi:MAG: hypothetical protein IJ174_03145 [Clostridia bacterium]|nr:hypothetical protein [Clostridia bacterium]
MPYAQMCFVRQTRAARLFCFEFFVTFPLIFSFWRFEGRLPPSACRDAEAQNYQKREKNFQIFQKTVDIGWEIWYHKARKRKNLLDEKETSNRQVKPERRRVPWIKLS